MKSIIEKLKTLAAKATPGPLFITARAHGLTEKSVAAPMEKLARG